MGGGVREGEEEETVNRAGVEIYKVKEGERE